MKLIFDRRQKLLMAVAQDGTPIRSWPAANNATSYSRGPWPAGIFRPREGAALLPVDGPAGAAAGAFGPWFLAYDVPERTGMGIHAGRALRPDQLGREGHEHATLGCIRTTEAAMHELAELVERHGLPELQVV